VPARQVLAPPEGAWPTRKRTRREGRTSSCTERRRDSCLPFVPSTRSCVYKKGTDRSCVYFGLLLSPAGVLANTGRSHIFLPGRKPKRQSPLVRNHPVRSCRSCLGCPVGQPSEPCAVPWGHNDCRGNSLLRSCTAVRVYIPDNACECTPVAGRLPHGPTPTKTLLDIRCRTLFRPTQTLIGSLLSNRNRDYADSVVAAVVRPQTTMSMELTRSRGGRTVRDVSNRFETAS
jgi:hypothetical protein